MAVSLPLRHDVLNLPSPDEQSIGNQRSVTPPWHRFRAHDGGRGFATVGHQLLEGTLELFRLHVVGISSKAGVLPANVHRIFLGLLQTAELRHVKVGQLRLLQMRR